MLRMARDGRRRRLRPPHRPRREPGSSALLATGFYELMERLARVPYQGQAGDFRLMSRRVVDTLREMPERRRFLRGMVAWVGFEQVPIEYRRAGRHGGPRRVLPRAVPARGRGARVVLRRAAARSPPTSGSLTAALCGRWPASSILRARRSPGWRDGEPRRVDPGRGAVPRRRAADQRRHPRAATSRACTSRRCSRPLYLVDRVVEPRRSTRRRVRERGRAARARAAASAASAASAGSVRGRPARAARQASTFSGSARATAPAASASAPARRRRARRTPSRDRIRAPAGVEQPGRPRARGAAQVRRSEPRWAELRSVSRSSARAALAPPRWRARPPASERGDGDPDEHRREAYRGTSTVVGAVAGVEPVAAARYSSSARRAARAPAAVRLRARRTPASVQRTIAFGRARRSAATMRACSRGLRLQQHVAARGRWGGARGSGRADRRTSRGRERRGAT